MNDTRDLALSTEVNDQLRLLKSLGHWVGDVHQPLHVSFDDDRGGNFVAITGPCRANLHAVWDNCIIEKKIGLDYADIAEKLRAEITEEDRARWIPAIVDTAAVVGWANEFPPSRKGRMCNIACGRITLAGMPPIKSGTGAVLKELSRLMMPISPHKRQQSGSGLRWRG